MKPSNVLMEGRTPILIDFGLARVADDPKLTHTGWLLGTPGYLAPEILYGDDATTASDVHSWARDRGLRRHRPPAVRPRSRRWRSWTGSAAASTTSPGIPEPLRRLLAEALDPEPQQRPDARRDPGAGCGPLATRRGRTVDRAADRRRRTTRYTVPLALAGPGRRADDETDVWPGHRRAEPAHDWRSTLDGEPTTSSVTAEAAAAPERAPPRARLLLGCSRSPAAALVRGVPLVRLGRPAARWSGCCAAARWPRARPATGGAVRGRKWYDGAQLLRRARRGTWSARSRAR